MALHSIIKLPSGFYGLMVNSTGVIIDAALIKWDGKTGTKYPYTNFCENFEMYQAANKTVYYTDIGGNDARVWCSGRDLNRHCHHLQQIAAR